MSEQGYIDKACDIIKEKVSKKQILAVIADVIILRIQVPPDIKQQALFLGIKIGCIALITLVALIIQWDLDKKGASNGKENGNSGVPADAGRV
jgi:hypothetical protein